MLNANLATIIDNMHISLKAEGISLSEGFPASKAYCDKAGFDQEQFEVKQTQKQTNRQRDRQKDRQQDKRTDRQTKRQTDRQTNKQTKRQTDRQKVGPFCVLREKN